MKYVGTHGLTIMLLKRDSVIPHQVASLEMVFLTACTQAPRSDDFSVARHALRQSPFKDNPWLDPL